MVDYGFCFRPILHRNDCSGLLHLWVDDPTGKTCFIPTSYEVRYYEWDPIKDRLVIPADSSERSRTLTGYADRMFRDLETLDNIVANLEMYGKCRVSNIINSWNNEMTSV